MAPMDCLGWSATGRHIMLTMTITTCNAYAAGIFAIIMWTCLGSHMSDRLQLADVNV